MMKMEFFVYTDVVDVNHISAANGVQTCPEAWERPPGCHLEAHQRG